MRNRIAAAMCAIALAAPGAGAHEPYVLPATFAPEQVVSVEASLTEGVFFVPDFALRGAQLQLVSPSGVRAPLPRAMEFRQLIAAEADLPEPGTYRITTGQWMGRITRAARVGGVWRTVRAGGGEGEGAPIDPANLPVNARVVDTRNVMIAETYVTRGAPSEGALAASGQGFELRPITHPNAIFAGEGFTLEFLNDGRPVRDLRFEIVRGGDQYSDQRITIDAVTDAQGRATIPFTQQGVYVLEARYPIRREGAAPPETSYLYTLTFEVTQ